MSIFHSAAIGKQQLTARQILTDPVLFLAFGFGSGLAKKAPGTFGTVAAIPLYLLIMQIENNGFYGVFTLLACVVGIWICDHASKKLGEHDFGGIVWDEIAGLLITLYGVPFSWMALLLGFVLFRFFDILKPWPIRWVDKHVSGGLGIMLDDVLAGLMAAGILQLIRIYFIF